MKKMRKTKTALVALALSLALLLCACGGSAGSAASRASTSKEDGRGDVFTTAILVADMSAGVSNGEELGLIQTLEVDTAEPITVEDLADGLSEWTGLDFYLDSAEVDGDSVWVDWSADSTLVAGLDDREQLDEFFMFDAVSMNWFMMDSMARTIAENLPVTSIYYSMDGGQPLEFLNPEDMASQGLPQLGLDEPYELSPFYVGHSDVVGDFMFYDEEYELVLFYPSTFMDGGEKDEYGIVILPSQTDGTVLNYWVVDNAYDEDVEAFMDRMYEDAGEMEQLEENIVIGLGVDLNMETGEEDPYAAIWLVDPDFIAIAFIQCETWDDAVMWYEQLKESAVYIMPA